MGADDVEAPAYVPEHSFCHFDDKAIRRGFIRKVFLILAAQLAVLTAMVLVTMLVDQIHDYVTAYENMNVTISMFITSIVIYFVSVLVLICVPGLRKRYPANLILLFIFTFSSAVMISIACTAYSVDSVMMALGITVLCCVGIFIFSFNTKYDLSSCHGFVFCLLWGLLLSSLLIPIPYSTTANKVFAGIGAIIFMFVLVYDIHRVMGRSEENALSPEEYIVGALEIYLDIINIFIRILQIVGRR